MKVANRLMAVLALVALGAAPVTAQQNGSGAPAEEKPAAEASKPSSLMRPIEVQHIRPLDTRGLNMFESPKEPGVEFEGFKLSWGAAFTQQFQGLRHENEAAENIPTGGTTDANELMEIGKGFNNATANLYLNAQLAPGIRVALTTYLSSRHHQEAWVKDGYLLIDASPLKVAALENLMKYVTVKAGHFEINYGDAHFRRTDNGMALYNPFVGNYIMDAFTTEIGGEVYVRAKGVLAMAGVTGGEIKGNVLTPEKRTPSYLAKLGFDRQINPNLRTRLTGSFYRNAKNPGGTLYAGDRAGSRYYFVMENTAASSTGNFRSGSINPAFATEVTAFQVNPFVKLRGLELFGVAEQASGRNTWNETKERQWRQYAADAVYRFGGSESFYVGGRYNTARGEFSTIANEVSANRWQLGAGWFLTPGVLMKAEYVTQKYNDFPVTDIRHNGKFNGFMVEGVVAF